MKPFLLVAAPLALVLTAGAAIACGPPKPARIGVWTPLPAAYARAGASPDYEPFATQNAMAPAREGCTPIARQVSGEDRPIAGQRLDQQPPARALFAVDRTVDGCHEVTFVSQRRR